ncbi:MAG: YifB family Mg chelatase-like AAA ATPase [Candidatus Omnitrophica bacterium]|nr:YifB family Mg chelatase-like AAA ATPase [Candidatus Omnitrophota bacterium]
MLSKVFSVSLIGLEAYPIEIEIDVSSGLPMVSMVGLPDPAVKESKERVKSAIKNSGYKYPSSRVTVNFAPADIRKEGPAFDLPAALGILAATEQIDPVRFREYLIIGELALNGEVRSVRGALPIALFIKKNRVKKIILPSGNAMEAGIVEGIEVYPVQSLIDAVGFLSGDISIAPCKVQTAELFINSRKYEIDFAEVKGQWFAKRALEIAAAGSHNMLMIGTPGSGKTMLASRLPTILPEMTLEESLETTMVYSAAGYLPFHQSLIAVRPFRSVHHTASDISLVGGGQVPKPGEISLAHNGVLFLDELPEFTRASLESLRQPLEERAITISRAAKSLRYPSDFMLLAAMNPCPCGFLGDRKKQCHCSPTQVQRYRAKISGPLLDRIDLHVEVPAVQPDELMDGGESEKSAFIKCRVEAARILQRERFKECGLYCNSQMNHRQRKIFCQIDAAGKDLLKMAIHELGISARAYNKILKVARTIADLSGQESIAAEHLAEAIQYRALDKNIWI